MTVTSGRDIAGTSPGVSTDRVMIEFLMMGPGRAEKLKADIEEGPDPHLMNRDGTCPGTPTGRLGSSCWKCRSIRLANEAIELRQARTWPWTPSLHDPRISPRLVYSPRALLAEFRNRPQRRDST